MTGIVAKEELEMDQRIQPVLFKGDRKLRLSSATRASMKLEGRALPDGYVRSKDTARMLSLLAEDRGWA